MPQLPKHLLGLSDTQLEGMCIDCGLCCHAKVEVAKGVSALIPELRCKYLMDKSGGEEGETCCSVYDRRLELAGDWCFPLAEAIDKGLFPKECPYVQQMDDYVGAQVLNDDVYKSLRPDLRKSAIEKSAKVGPPKWAHSLDWAHFVYSDEER